jgi:hypothetical protein
VDTAVGRKISTDLEVSWDFGLLDLRRKLAWVMNASASGCVIYLYTCRDHVFPVNPERVKPHHSHLFFHPVRASVNLCTTRGGKFIPSRENADTYYATSAKTLRLVAAGAQQEDDEPSLKEGSG